MSASSKKKLRKEQSATALTEKQRAELKEAKKLKAYSITFISVMLVVVIVAVTVMAATGINRTGIFQKNTIAAVVEGHELNTVEMTYYFKDAIAAAYSEWYNYYGNNTDFYVSWFYGLDVNKSLNRQQHSEGKSWADYFMETALENARSNYALYDLAVKNGHTLTEDEQKTVDTQKEYLLLEAQFSGYSIDRYLQLIYGFGATEESYDQYTKISSIARSYYAHIYNELTYDEEAVRAYEEGKYNNYSSFTYGRYYLNYKNYLPGDSKEDKDYSAEQIAAAKAAALTDAQKLAQAKNEEELKAAILGLSINAENPNASISTDKDILFSKLDSEYAEWLGDRSRNENDITYVEDTSTNMGEDDKEVTEGNGSYYVILFKSRNDNLRLLANVRHLLVKFEGGTTDKDGNTVYPDEKKAEAKAEAEGYLKTWKEGDATEDSFAALVKEKTDDTGSKESGGLFEDITPASSYVENFLNWCIDENRKKGDTDVIETEYGYHVMYYVGDGEMSYRDYMIRNDMRNEDMKEWFDGVMEPISASFKNLTFMNLSTTVSSAIAQG